MPLSVLSWDPAGRLAVAARAGVLVGAAVGVAVHQRCSMSAAVEWRRAPVGAVG